MIFKKLVTIFFLISNFIFALQIGPPMFEQRIDGAGGYREFTLTNPGTKTLRYKLTVLPGKNKDMSRWTEVSPKIITIKPGTKGKFKIFAKAPSDIPDGEYDYNLSIKMMDLPKLPGETDKVDAAAKLNFDFHLGFIGYAGDLEPNIEITNTTVTKNSDGKLLVKGTIINKTQKRGIHCGIIIIGGDRTLLSTDLRVSKGEKKDFSYLLNEDLKPSDVDGISIRNLENDKELIKTKF